MIQQHSTHISEAQMRRYVADQLPPHERHAVERHLLACELCADAVEGLSALPATVNPSVAVHHLKNQIRERAGITGNPDRKLIPALFRPLNIAAAVGVLLAGTVLFTTVDWRKPEPASEISLAKPSINEKPALSAPKTSVQKQDQSVSLNQSAQPKPDRIEKVERQRTPEPLALQESDATETEEVVADNNVSLPPEAAIDQIEEKVEAEEALPSVPPVYPPAERNARMEDAKAKKSLSVRPAPVGIGTRVKTVMGNVTSADGDVPLAGVKVAVKGTAVATVTNEKGSFRIPVSSDNQLWFIREGYDTLEVAVPSKDSLHVQLVPEYFDVDDTLSLADSVEETEQYGEFYKANPENGYKTFRQYLRTNLRYPAQAKERKITGTVRLEFVIQPDGKLTDFRVRKGLGYGCDEEAIRVVKEGPAWKPARVNGKPTRQKVWFGVPFAL